MSIDLDPEIEGPPRSMSVTNTTSLTTGLPTTSSSDTDILVAAVVNNINQQGNDVLFAVDGNIQPSQVAESALASMSAVVEGGTVPGKVKPRGRKSLGSGTKRSEASKRKYICSFSHYGCDVTLSSKNEWKRHVHIQHLQLGFYRCDVGSCNPDNNPNTPPHKKVYNDFNRKDLFTQHHRRMHRPESGPGSNANAETNSSDWRAFEDSLEEVRARCWQERRKPPARSTCGFCGKVFDGDNSWNERMEHVGGHYSRDLPEAAKEEREDEDITHWAVAEGILKEGPNGRHILIDQPVSTTEKTYNTRSSDAVMTDPPPYSPTNGQSVDGQFIGAQDSRRQSLPPSAYPPVNGSSSASGRPGSSSGQQHTPCYCGRNVPSSCPTQGPPKTFRKGLIKLIVVLFRPSRRFDQYSHKPKEASNVQEASMAMRKCFDILASCFYANIKV